MKITYEDIVVKIVEATNDELVKLRSLLEFENGSLLFNDNEFYFGLIDYLKNNGLNIDYSLLLNKLSYSSKVTIHENCLIEKKLRDYQISSVRKALHRLHGVFQIATGGGKTVIIAAIIYHFLNYVSEVDSAICIVPTTHLLRQMYNEFVSVGFEESSISRLGDGYKLEDKPICIATSDSAYNQINKLKDRKLLIVDEAHHVSSRTWTTICTKINTRYRFAFTGTVREDPNCYSYSDLALIGLFGPIIQNVKAKQLINRGYLAQPIYTIIDVDSKKIPGFYWHSIYQQGVVKNLVRNELICKLSYSCYINKYKVLCFVARKDHGKFLCKKITDCYGIETLFTQGGSTSYLYKPSGKVSKNNWDIKEISDYVNENNEVIVVATQVFDEGVNIPSFNTLIIAAGMKKYRRSIQRCGRGMRPKEKDNFVYIFDFYDGQHVFLSSQSNYRIETYDHEGYIYKSLDEIKEVTGIDCITV